MKGFTHKEWMRDFIIFAKNVNGKPVTIFKGTQQEFFDSYEEQHDLLIQFMSYYGDLRTKSNRINEDKLFKRAAELLKLK